LPFGFAAAIVVGPEGLAHGFPLAAALAVGTVLHVLLSIVFGVAVWEINFLAVLPVVAPQLTARLDLATQVWNGIASYSLVYGPALALYVIRVRPGMLDRWWRIDGEVT
jgi:hypothetical protein